MPSETSFFGQLLRWFRIGRAETNRITTEAERNHLEALIQEQQVRNKERLMKAKEAVDGAFGQKIQIETQVADDERKYKVLIIKYKALVAANQTDAAGKMALQIQSLKETMATNKAQLETAIKNADTAVKILQQAAAEQKRSEEKAKQDIAQFKLNSALASSIEANSQLASGFDQEAARSQRLNQMASEMASNAKGRLEVSQRMVDDSGVIMKEAEEKAMQAAAMADLDAELNLTPTTKKSTATEGPTVVKEGM